MENKLILGDCIIEMQKLPPESVDLIIADPPYWRVIKEKWDYEWKTEDDYIQWSIKWIEQATRILRKGGTLYLFGYFRTLALLTSHFPNYGLELRQQIIIDKGMKSVSGRATKNYKIFPNVTESVLMIVKDSKPFIKEFLKNRQKELKLSSKTINERLGVKSNGGGMWSIYTGENICEQVPTAELWARLENALEFTFPYNKLAQTFNAQMGFTDVWTDINFYKEDRIHPTQKPIKLITRLVDASSNKGDLILDPFSGSGSTVFSCLNTERNYIAIEKDKGYFDLMVKKINNLTQKSIDFNDPPVGMAV